MSLVVSLEAKEGVAGIIPEENQHCLPWKLPQGRTLLLHSLGNAGLLSSCMGWEATFTGGGEVVSTGKEEFSELRGPMSSA